MTKRPVRYSDALVDEICFAISTCSIGLHRLCAKNKHWPEYQTLFNWLKDGKHQYFVDLYARAKEEQADFMADEINEIADTQEIGEKTKITGTGRNKVVEVTKGDMIEHRRLRIDARKWTAAKLKPKKYSDKIQHDVTINKEQPLFPDENKIE